MPAIYGEGTKAFVRLQEEIARQTNDLTLFAWRQIEATPQQYRGILAQSPDEFAHAWSIVPTSDRRFNEEFSMTNKGLRIKADPSQSGRGDYFLGLGCSYQNEPDEQIGIYLKHHGAGLYARQLAHLLPVDKEPPSPAVTTIYIDKHLSPTASESIDKRRRHGIRLRRGFEDVLVTNALPADQWDRKHKVFLTGKSHSTFAGILTLRSERWTGDLTIMCALLVQGAVPKVKFIDDRYVDSVLKQPHNVRNLPDDALQDEKFNLELSVGPGTASAQEPAFCVDLLEHQKKDDAEQPASTWRRIISSYLNPQA
jgi:hypothetical protein